MTLIGFLKTFERALRKHHRFETSAKLRLLRTWVQVSEGGHCSLDPISFVYWIETGKVSNEWLKIAKFFGIKERVAWRLRYAADNRVPRSVDRHSKVQALRIRKRLISIIIEMRRYHREKPTKLKAFPYHDMMTRRSERFAYRRLHEHS